MQVALRCAMPRHHLIASFAVAVLAAACGKSDPEPEVAQPVGEG